MIKITIYVDIIFLENLIVNSIILDATSVILKIKKALRTFSVQSAFALCHVVLHGKNELSIVFLENFKKIKKGIYKSTEMSYSNAIIFLHRFFAEKCDTTI